MQKSRIFEFLMNKSGTIKFDTNNGNDGPSGIRVRESKVYHTEKEADEVVQINKSRQQNSRKL